MSCSTRASDTMEPHCSGGCQTGGPSSKSRTQEIDFCLKKKKKENDLDMCLNS